jgi:hypothetical protein
MHGQGQSGELSWPIFDRLTCSAVLRKRTLVCIFRVVRALGRSQDAYIADTFTHHLNTDISHTFKSYTHWIPWGGAQCSRAFPWERREASGRGSQTNTKPRRQRRLRMPDVSFPTKAGWEGGETIYWITYPSTRTARKLDPKWRSLRIQQRKPMQYNSWNQKLRTAKTETETPTPTGVGDGPACLSWPGESA